MKTVKLIRAIFILLVFVCFSGISSYALEPLLPPSQHLQEVIKQGIKYPEQAVKNCCSGSVDVYFTVDENGKIKIEKTFSENEKIEKMVKEQLASICCKGVKVASFEHYKITITFKLIG
jgi:outer membrane biosynthesis protein TonB